MLNKVRPILGLLLALTLVVSGGVQGVEASDMAVKMSTASTSNIPMPGGCSGCSGDDGLPMACFAVCGSTMSAILPAAPSVAPSALASPTALFITAVVGHHEPPDPYPPRPTSLS